MKAAGIKSMAARQFLFFGGGGKEFHFEIGLAQNLLVYRDENVVKSPGRLPYNVPFPKKNQVTS